MKLCNINLLFLDFPHSLLVRDSALDELVTTHPFVFQLPNGVADVSSLALPFLCVVWG